MSLNRFEASLTKAMTPFVGREREVALLAERWRDANEGEGQVVLLSGEAGIGKSRILANLREHIGEGNHVAMSFQSSAHHVNEPFYPVLGPIWRAAGFVSDEPAEQRLDKLEAFIALAGLARSDFAPVLAALFSIPTAARYPAFDMPPNEAKQRTIGALMALFEGLAARAPVLALVEDAHWIDPSSLDLFGQLVERALELPVLLVISFRPEFSPPWVGRPNVTAYTLNRLGRRHSLEMIRRLTAGKPLPDEVLEQIVAKTDGVPLFVEELTKTVLESDLLREEDERLRASRRAFAAGDSVDLARFADVATRPLGGRAGHRADRRRDRTRIFPSPDRGGCADLGSGPADRTRSTRGF